jgi:1,4-alpha-glucan branching enzyme
VCGRGARGTRRCSGKRCWFTDYLPDFNFENAAARKFSVDNAIKWIKDTGIDGFRLDAVKHIADPWLFDMRARVKADIEPVTQEHFYMVGETFTGRAGDDQVLRAAGHARRAVRLPAAHADGVRVLMRKAQRWATWPGSWTTTTTITATGS